MSQIKSKHTKPEMAVRRMLHAEGFRYSLHSKSLRGKPDLALKKYKIAVFIHGCFWHGHDCEKVRKPKSNVDYWLPKIKNNQQRDIQALASLKKQGWHPVTIWECSLDKDARKLLRLLKRKREKAQFHAMKAK